MVLVPSFHPWPYTTFQSIPIILKLLTNRNISVIYSVIICEPKTKDCARSGSFQHNLKHHCFQLWCLPVSWPVSSTNYNLIYIIIWSHRTKSNYISHSVNSTNPYIPLAWISDDYFESFFIPPATSETSKSTGRFRQLTYPSDVTTPLL